MPRSDDEATIERNGTSSLTAKDETSNNNNKIDSSTAISSNLETLASAAASSEGALAGGSPSHENDGDDDVEMKEAGGDNDVQSDDEAGGVDEVERPSAEKNGEAQDEGGERGDGDGTISDDHSDGVSAGGTANTSAVGGENDVDDEASDDAMEVDKGDESKATSPEEPPHDAVASANNSVDKSTGSDPQQGPRSDVPTSVPSNSSKPPTSPVATAIANTTHGATGTTSSTATPAPAAPGSAAVAAAALPVMKGTFSYDLEQRRHLIRGMWNFENSTQFPPQRFELLRTLPMSEDLTKIPTDGEFHGSFSLAYMHTTSKGKQKERSKVISESGVNISFVPDEGKPGCYIVNGKGTNQFGIFHINGTATPSGVDGDPTLNVVLRKRYEAQPVVVPAASALSTVPTVVPTSKVPPAVASSASSLPLPPPSQSFPSGVVCLRGKLFKEESNDLGVTEVVHRINGSWAAGLDVFHSDPENLRKLQNRFEYEHKSSIPSTTAFPVSGKYSGWFDLGNEDGTRTRINERDVTLKFRKNSAGYYNVEGKGSNVFGKYNITGTLENEIITIFRHFLPRKPKIKTVDGNLVESGPPGAAATAVGALASSSSGPAASVFNSRRPSALLPQFEPKFKLSDVPVPKDADSSDGKLEPTHLPANGAYSAVSRGVLRLNDDGSHSCQGKWAVTREHFTNGATSNFNFRLESHLAAAAAVASGDRAFPIDSEMYKGSFQLKKQGSRHQTIVDQQLVLKFRMNVQGAYNVYGKGINAIGEFNLVGTLVMSGKTGGQVELYRMYPPEKLAPLPGPKAAVPGPVASSTGILPKPDAASRSLSVSNLPGPPPASHLQRRESTRLVKLPSKLEDDDPTAVISRALSKCSQILQFMREKDAELGGFFNEPVDPVALGIPTYHQIIKEPMDLRTIHRRMEAESISSPDEFARLCRLVFENAMTFNIDPAHSVHQAARSLLVIFNQKFRDVERIVQNVRRDGDEKGKKKLKEDKKRKRQVEEVKSLKKRRLEEAQAMATANVNAVSAILAAAPLVSTPNVTRPEFNMLLNMIQELQRQVVATHTAVAELSPGDEGENDAMSVVSGPNPASVSSSVPTTVAQHPPPERKKSVKRKSEATAPTDSASAAASAAATAAAAALDDARPLTLDEQELLTETINDLPPEHLGGVIQIIREAAPVGADEDEIDLEIDQLDTRTQRKLLRHVLKFVKKSKVKKVKKPQQPKKADAGPAPKKAKPTPTPAAPPAPAPKASSDSFFGFQKQYDSDSDSDDDDGALPRSNAVSMSQPGGKSLVQTASSDFQLGSGLADLHDDDDDDRDENAGGSGGFAANWNMSKAEDKSERSDDEDDAWGAAREHAAAAKAREAERKAREEKMKAEAEAAKEQRLADAAARGEELRAQRLEEEANEARLREQQEKEAEEARKAAREAARAQVQSVEQTVDLDAQRDIMKQYEQSYLDKDLGSASPSSDFGF